jgi:hypothetical protein
MTMTIAEITTQRNSVAIFPHFVQVKLLEQRTANESASVKYISRNDKSGSHVVGNATTLVD